MINLKKNRVNEFAIVILVLTFAFMFLPYFLYGKNCVITIHDNLDSNIPWFKYVRDNAYYFNLNTKSTTLDNLSTLYFAGDFTYKGIIYYIFDTFKHFCQTSEFNEIGWWLLMLLVKEGKEKDELRNMNF